MSSREKPEPEFILTRGEVSMSDHQKPVNVDSLLEELEGMDVPPMTPEFEARAMDRIRQRKAEMDQQEKAAEDLPAESNIREIPAARPAAAAAGKNPEGKEAGGTPAKEEVKGSPAGESSGARILRPRFRGWIAAAAAAVFLVGGTLLTRGSLRPSQELQSGAPIVLSGTPTSYDPSRPDAPEGQGEGQNPEQGSGAVLFLEDMWLFLKAALPYLGSAAAGAAVTAFVLRKKEK